MAHFRTLLSDFVPALRQAQAAYAVLALGLALSVAAWYVTGQWVGGATDHKFQSTVDQAVDTLEQRFQDNVNILLGIKGLFAASSQVERDEFRLYLSELQIEQRFPGLRLIAYAALVPHAQKAAFEARVRQDRSVDPLGYPDFSIKPPGDRADYLVVTFVEPMLGNQRGFGFDLYSEAPRRGALEGLRDGGHPTASPPLRLVSDPDRSTTFVLRVPIYRRGMPVKTVEERRTAFQGVVSAAIHVDELLRGLLGMQLSTEFDLAVYDADVAGAPEKPGPPLKESLLFNSRPAAAGSGPARAAMVEIAGRKWRLVFSPKAAGVQIERALPPVVFVGGLLVSFLLFWLIGTLTVSRARALRLAEQSTAVRATESLREQLDFIQQLIETVPQPIFFKAVDGRNLGVNRAWEKYFDIGREQFIGKTVFDLYPHDQELARRHHARDQELFARPGSQSYEAAIVTADGKVHHTIYNKATFNRADGSVAGLIGTITDITGMKDAEAALRESEARFRSLTTLSSDWYWEQDAEYRFVDMTNEIDRMTGVTALSHIGKRRWELAAPNMTEADWAAHRAVVEAHQPFHDLELCRIAEDGSTHWVRISGEPIFDRDGVFKGYRGVGKDITVEKQVQERIRHMAQHDALTDLPNRLLLYDRIGQLVTLARRNPRVFALLFIDLDRFKNVNDTLGHQVGDQLLQAVAGRLLTCTRKSDTVARIGGDEFVVLLSGVSAEKDAGTVAQKVLELLSQPFRVGSNDLHVTPSVGICTYPKDGDDVEMLMRNADTAMYHAKEMGRNNYQFYTSEMNATAQRRRALEDDLRRALEHGGLALHYQPQLDVESGEIIGFEALARWPHPERGMVPPAEFIPVAEETGMIDLLGEWVLQRACAQAAEWSRAGHPPLRVAVNLSPHQFRRDGTVGAVERALAQTGLPAARLELEITESAILHQSEQAIMTFRALSDMGLQISIDDFGTGYSSLSCLKRFPIGRLKIDGSLVRDVNTNPGATAMVTAIIAVAHCLGLEVTAEGVETAGQLAFLKTLGCDRAQGYYFSKPLPAEDFAKLLLDRGAEARAATA